METNPETKNIATGISAEGGALAIPIPHQAGPQEFRYNENGLRLYPPSTLLWAPASPPISHDQGIGGFGGVGAGENADHAITVPEPHVCRICLLDEDESDDDVLVELGCCCRGQMSRMHRKCILKWYGVRMILEKSYKCELCNTALHPEAQLLVVRGVTDRKNGGRAIILEALKSAMAQDPRMDIEMERAATYQELAHLIDNKGWIRLRREIIIHAVNSRQAGLPATNRTALIVLIGTTAFAVGLCTFLVHHFYGDAAFH